MSYDYLAIWSIADRTRTLQELTSEASPDLAEMLEDAGYATSGPIAWSRTDDRLTARVPVIRVEPALPGDMRPWMSRLGAAAELFDGVAA